MLCCKYFTGSSLAAGSSYEKEWKTRKIFPWYSEEKPTPAEKAQGPPGLFSSQNKSFKKLRERQYFFPQDTG